MRHLMCFVMLTAVSVIGGCSSEASVSGVIPVSGKVTYQGDAIEGATVIFTPAGDNRSASGITDSDGNYKLTTLQAGDGALPGDYQVTIYKTEEVDPMSDEERQKYFHEHQGRMPPIKTRELLPAKYKQPATAGLTAKVQSGKNDFPYELVD